MDASWNSSQWISLHQDVSPTNIDSGTDDEQPLPQLDGLTDDQSNVERVVH